MIDDSCRRLREKLTINHKFVSVGHDGLQLIAYVSKIDKNDPIIFENYVVKYVKTAQPKPAESVGL